MHDAFALHIHGSAGLRPDEVDVAHLVAALQALQATAAQISPDTRVALIGVADGSWTLLFRLLVGTALALTPDISTVQLMADAAANDEARSLAQFAAYTTNKLGAGIELVPVRGPDWQSAKAALQADTSERYTVAAELPEAPLPSYSEEVERVVHCVGVRTDTATVWLNLLNGRVTRASIPKETVERWSSFLRDKTPLRVVLQYQWNPTSLRMTRTRVKDAVPVEYQPVDHVALVRAMATAFQAVEPDPEAWLRRIREGEE